MTRPGARVTPEGGASDVRSEVVEAIMRRAGVRLAPAQFVYEVARAYGSVAPTRGGERLELSHVDPVFNEAIRHSGAADTVLALGCGDGLSGFDPTYARREYVGVWPSTLRLEEQAVTPPLLWDESAWPRGPFDTVVHYLMVHYIYDIALFFTMIRRIVAPGGAYVMAGHNARFWRIAELREAADKARAALRDQSRWRRYFQFGTWARRARRLFTTETAPDLRTRVNQALSGQLGVATDLTFPEIAHLVDIHRPPPDPDPLQIGMAGFDVEHLTRKYLDGFTLEFYKSRTWSGYVSHDKLPPSLREHDLDLARRYPDDGVFFAACWRRKF